MSEEVTKVENPNAEESNPIGNCEINQSEQSKMADDQSSSITEGTNTNEIAKDETAESKDAVEDVKSLEESKADDGESKATPTTESTPQTESEAPASSPNDPDSNASKDVTPAAPEEASPAAPEDGPSTTPEEPPSTTPEELTPAAPEEAPTTAPEEAPTTTPVEAPSTLPEEVPAATPEEAPTTVPEEAPTTSPEEVPPAAPEEAPSTAPEEEPSTAPEEVPPAAPEEAPCTAPEEEPSTAPEEVPPAAPEETPSTAPEEKQTKTPEEVPPAAPEKAPSTAPEEEPSTGPEEVPSSASEEVSATTPEEATALTPGDNPASTQGEVPTDSTEDSSKKETIDIAPEEAATTEVSTVTEEEAQPSVLKDEPISHEEATGEVPVQNTADAHKTESEGSKPVKPAPPKVLPKPKFEPPEIKVDLFVKAHSKYPNKLGDCPFCHRIMMLLKLKKIGGTVCPVNLSVKSREFEDYCARNGLPTKVPILQHGETVIGDSNAIADYVDKIKVQPKLACLSKATNAAGDKVFLKFSAFIKNKIKANDEKLAHALTDELGRLDNFLSTSPGCFLDGDSLMHPDCVLLPKMHHVRVAAKHYKNYDIPENFKYIHSYLAAADNHPAFASTKPADDAIIEGWRKHAT